MKNSKKILQSLLNYLGEIGIQFSWVSDDGMKDKAVTSFSLDLKTSPCVLCGTFSDQTREIISIAHEAGHILTYQEMNREESCTYLCSTFAAHGIGLNKISPAGQESMLTVEIKASVKGLDILSEIVLTNEELNLAKKSMSQWYSTYEKLLPGNPNTIFFKGLSLEGMKKIKDAASEYYQYLQIVQEGKQAQYAYRRLVEWGYIKQK